MIADGNREVFVLSLRRSHHTDAVGPLSTLPSAPTAASSQLLFLVGLSLLPQGISALKPPNN